MKPVKIAMMGMTHGHTRKYYQTLRENKKLQWVASCAEDEKAKEVYELYKNGVPCYLDPEEMLADHPDIEAVVIASANDRHYEQMKFCDFWAFERPLASHILQEEYGHPVLSIDRPYNVRGSGQLRTRFQAFVEALEIKKIQKGGRAS